MPPSITVLSPRERFKKSGLWSAHEELRKYVLKVKSNKSLKSNDLFLLDFELRNQKTDGLELAKEIGVTEQAILVTSHWDNEKVIKSCKEVNMPLIPKNLVGALPLKIDFSNRDNLWFVLIDDNKGIRTTAKMMAKKENRDVIALERGEDFYPIKDSIPLETLIIIDWNLNHGRDNGGDVGRKLSKLGFSNIYIITGEDSRRLPKMNWIKGIIDDKNLSNIKKLPQKGLS